MQPIPKFFDELPWLDAWSKWWVPLPSTSIFITSITTLLKNTVKSLLQNGFKFLISSLKTFQLLSTRVAYLISSRALVGEYSKIKLMLVFHNYKLNQYMINCFLNNITLTWSQLESTCSEDLYFLFPTRNKVETTYMLL